LECFIMSSSSQIWAKRFFSRFSTLLLIQHLYTCFNPHFGMQMAWYSFCW
jgi:hypothetical protein